MSSLTEKIHKIAEDLLNLEVNTILCDNIEGVKMPDPRHALLDIAKWYDAKLIALEAWRFPETKHNDCGGLDAFDQLRSRASAKITELENKWKELTEKKRADLIILYRIRDKSDQLKGMFLTKNMDIWKKGLTRIEINSDINGDKYPLPLNPNDLVLLRKIWELGTEEIAMQTVIQLDGDVITRIQRNYATPSPTNETVQKLHNEGVSKSISFWKELVGIIGDFFNLIVKVFFKK